ncbi:MAG: BON domain-containing protein [Humidesulfovibrio sp.]|uniref:BON domain-containing protein n=1 Tax=Humidesulfovibrio sp. TaxID=2910988 RepID=UPI0027F8E3C6|nr:BON domain-containing protein [Humidesulfovibrio sp.]MDQ7833995.1 BON domain-containing protein [Humidesulfovibrio sp.]
MARHAKTALLMVALMLMAFCASLFAAQSGRDLEITAAVTQALIRENPLENTRIDVKTFEGVVILGGFVDEYSKMQRIIEVAKGIDGVKSVDNRIWIWDRD